MADQESAGADAAMPCEPTASDRSEVKINSQVVDGIAAIGMYQELLALKPTPPYPLISTCY